MGNVSSFPWLPGRGGESEKLSFVPGLQNLGNNCFLNVILQALSSCSRFHEYLNNIVEEYETLPVGQARSMLPLTIAVADLMEELITLRDRKVTLSPRKVMCAVQCYNTSFSLAVQQDAAEVFLHLLSSLREEVSASYNPNNGSLIDVSAVPRRILDPRMLVKDQNEQKRWRELYLGPFDGILGNILTCRSCSFQIMMDYEFFHNLPLLPVTGMGTSIFYGCTLEHCLKQYIAAEEVDGYKCDNCWHIAAMECLSVANGKETDIDKLKYCSGQEKCDCRLLAGIDAIPVPVSRAFKQLNIARCPEILCIHLMRASTNLYGELIKLEGHISFPLILTLSPFLRSGVEMEHTSRRDASNQGQQFYPLCCINRQINVGALSHVYFPHKENKHSATSDDRPLVLSSLNTNKDVTDTVDETEESSSQIEGRSDSRSGPENMLEHYKQKARAPRVPPLYRLVSVVEHMGKTGGGHYTVYRRTKSQRNGEEPNSVNMASPDQWFLVSDSDVHPVTEKDVLSAQASILFYERINET
ncbi:unnamed protein product [Rhodiola kirilowii]